MTSLNLNASASDEVGQHLNHSGSVTFPLSELQGGKGSTLMTSHVEKEGCTSHTLTRVATALSGDHYAVVQLFGVVHKLHAIKKTNFESFTQLIIHDVDRFPTLCCSNDVKCTITSLICRYTPAREASINNKKNKHVAKPVVLTAISLILSCNPAFCHVVLPLYNQ
ncbi:transmembrane protein, putative [Medicago truncatula]|uniref:Transmembrane protein, putative n=1 Tax=Medicago truncatula TaxID=3880 RepID=G7LIN3_MEDTR|nr:transmembrane protein, putative [Medicago truncatula]